jgi:hypothetical protein
MNETEYQIYEPFNKGDDLFQGDIILREDPICKIFGKIHPHFMKDKYTAFMVLTQSCDLVRRKQKNGVSECRSRYINLAVIRPLDEVLPVLLDKECGKVIINGTVAEHIYEVESKRKAKQLLQRIFNQNEQALGIFYLPPKTSVKIAVPSVALLQVSVALRAVEHYETIRESRWGRLAPAFQSKLGWLVGTLFSRVATPDMPKAELNELTKQFLGSEKDHRDSEIGVRWVPQKVIKTADSKNAEIEALKGDEIVSEVMKYKPDHPLDVAIKRIFAIMEKLGFTAPEIEQLENYLRNDKDFIDACRK